jgi:hypothetical protein
MQSEVNQEENLNTTDFDEHFAKISSYIVDTLHGVPLEMTEDEKEQFRIQVISNQYAERLLSEAEKTETYRGLSKLIFSIQFLSLNWLEQSHLKV